MSERPIVELQVERPTAAIVVGGTTENFIRTEADDPITTEAGEVITTE